jgi:hypothetical protein
MLITKVTILNISIVYSYYLITNLLFILSIKLTPYAIHRKLSEIECFTIKNTITQANSVRKIFVFA